MLIIFLLVGNTGKNDRTSQVTSCAFSSLPTLVTGQIRVHKEIQSPPERTHVLPNHYMTNLLLIDILQLGD